MTRARTPRLRRTGRSRPATEAFRALSARDCTVLGLVLVEHLSPVEAAVALGVSVAQVRRDYDTAVARVRRSLASIVGRARAAAASSRAAAAWRRAS